MVAALAIALLSLAAGLTSPPSAHAASASTESCRAGEESLDCMRLHLSGSGGFVLALHPGALSNQQVVVDRMDNGQNRFWKLSVNRADATFEIVNKSTGTCVGSQPTAERYDVLVTANCQNKGSQRWYFNPGPGNKLMVRNVDSGKCLAAFGADVRNSRVGDPVIATPCQLEARGQLWLVGSGPYSAVWDLAIDHAANTCQKSTDTCTWNAESEAPAAPLPGSCGSKVWYNDTPYPLDHVFTRTKTTGYSNEVGSELEVGFETGAVGSLIAKVTAKLKVSAKVVWSNSHSEAEQTKFTVKPGEYGWYELAKVAQKVTGTWTFGIGGLHTWTVRDTVTVPLEHANGLTTIYVAKSSPTPPRCSF